MLEYVEEQELDEADRGELPEGVRCFLVNRRYTCLIGQGTQDGKHFQTIVINPLPTERELPAEIWNSFRSDPRQGSPTGVVENHCLKLWSDHLDGPIKDPTAIILPE